MNNKRLIVGISLMFVFAVCFFLFVIQSRAQSIITITGRAYDTADNSPVGQAAIVITGNGFSGSASTDDGGIYSVGSCHTGVDLTISCMKAGYRHYSTVIPAISTTTTAASYAHDIPLTTMIPAGAVGYDTEQEGVIYIMEKGQSTEGAYAPGVDPDELEERKLESKEMEDQTEAVGDIETGAGSE